MAASSAWIVSGLTAAIALASPAQTAPAAHDWNQYPAVAVLVMPNDLYALGDVHGDFDRLAELLAGAKLIDRVPPRPEDVQWSGGAAVLVCTGDLIDKYTENLSVIALMRAIEPQARAAGGRVVITLGNHEAEFLAGGGNDHKAAEFTKELQAAGLAPEDVAGGHDRAGIGTWMRDLPVAAKVGGWFFCHAGDTEGRTLDQITEQSEKEVGAEGFRADILLNPHSLLEARMHPRPWWEWDGTEPRLRETGAAKKEKREAAEQTGEKRLRACVEALGCKHLVFGHQPGAVGTADGAVRKAGAMFCAYDGLAYLIDTGMSRGVDGGRGALLWVHAKSTERTLKVIYADGKIEDVER